MVHFVKHESRRETCEALLLPFWEAVRLVHGADEMNEGLQPAYAESGLVKLLVAWAPVVRIERGMIHMGAISDTFYIGRAFRV